MTTDVEAARTRASWSALAYLAHRGAGATVRELAAAAGISERTFYRYFPTREDILRPAMHDAQDAIGTEVARQEMDVPLGEALLAGFAATADGPYLNRTLTLLPAVLQSPTYFAVWSQELRCHGTVIRSAVAERLDSHVDDVRVDVAVTIFLSLVELALTWMVRTGDDPVDLLRAQMRAATCGIFDAPRFARRASA